MKIKKNAMMTALAFSVAVNLNGCAYGPPFDPSNNANQNAYGPPPPGYFESAPDDESFDPSDNFEAGAYGPPIGEYREIDDESNTNQ